MDIGGYWWLLVATILPAIVLMDIGDYSNASY
jgi:hypothetical protein